MNLELFTFIEKSINILEEKHSDISHSASLLELFFIENFSHAEGFLSINSRIKSKKSFREKIIRNHLYMKNKSAESVFMNVRDIIGLRIECRFIEDEHKIYREITRCFSKHVKEGYYTIDDNSKIFLQLDDAQPQLQKNGFEIYKIDGYILSNERINFELQIKSLVNVFWGEIDHRVLYKNYNYMITEDFFRDIMHSIKDNLSMIDRQLMILYDHVNKMDSSAEQSNREQVKSLLSKIIHDIYVGKIRKELGFVIDFSLTTDVIVEYLYFKCREILKYNYGENFIRLLNRINTIADFPLDIYSYIPINREPIFASPFSKKVGQEILSSLNVDFGWNLFFKIISQIEHSDPIEDFEEFILYLEGFLRKNIEDKIRGLEATLSEKEEIVDFLLNIISKDIVLHHEMDYVLEACFLENKYNLSHIFRNIVTFDDFIQNKERIARNILGNISIKNIGG